MKKTINGFRKEIDQLDSELIKIISERVRVVREVGKIKKKEKLDPFNEKRRQEVLEKWKANAKKVKVSEEFAEKIYKALHEYSLEIESKNK